MVENEINNFWNKLPNNLVWTYKKGEVSICQDNDLLLPVLIYLNQCKNNIGFVQFTLEDLILECGLKINKHKGGSVYKVKEALKQVQNIGWLRKTVSFDKISLKEFIKIKFDISYDKDKDNNDIHFFVLYSENFYKIINSNNKLNKLKVLKIYCYFLSRLGKNNSEQLDSLEYCNGYDTTVDSFYDTYSKMCEDLNISDKSLTLYLQLLEDLELIFTGNIGLVKNSHGQTHMANNIYTCSKDNLKRALKCSKDYYIDNGYTIIGKKNTKTHRKSNGLKCNITKENIKGNSTKELEEKLKTK